VKAPFNDWLEILDTRSYHGMEGLFIHPDDPAAMAGNGTIGLEILEDLADVDTVVVPYGGGSLSCGIASAMHALKAQMKVYACEVETGAPLAASLAAGEPIEVGYTSSFVDGISAPRVFLPLWPVSSQLLAGSLVASLAEVASAIRLLAERNHVIAEGAAACAVAAALTGRAGPGKIVAIVSGGNIDLSKFASLVGACA
jgi:threonine dehydratase